MSNYIDQIKVDSTTYNILPAREISETSATLDNLKEIPASKKMVRVSLTASPVGNNDGIGLQAGLKSGEELFAVITPTLNGTLTASGPKVHNITGDSIKFSRETPFIIHFTCLSDKSGAESYLAEHFLINPTKLGDITLKEADLGDYLLSDGSCAKFTNVKSDSEYKSRIQNDIVGVCVTRIIPPGTPQYKYFIAVPSFNGNAYSKLNYAKFTKYFSTSDTELIWDGYPAQFNPVSVPDSISLMNGNEWTGFWAEYGSSSWEAISTVKALPQVNGKSWWIPAPGEVAKLFGTLTANPVWHQIPTISTAEIAIIKAVRDSFQVLGIPFFNFLINGDDALTTATEAYIYIYTSVHVNPWPTNPKNNIAVILNKANRTGYIANQIKSAVINEKFENSTTIFGPILMPMISFSKSEF